MTPSGSCGRRRTAALLTLTVLLSLSTVAPARAQDSLAPRGAEPHWLPNEQWVNLLWLPYDESRLYDVLGTTRGAVFRWVRDDASHTLAQLARRRGLSARAAAARLVADRRGRVSPRLFRTLRQAAERTLTQGHLSQHLLFHALHQTAVASGAKRIFGVVDQEQFLDLRRAELSPLQIGDLHGRTRSELRAGVARALRSAVGLGRRRGFLTPSQAGLLLDRQLRQIPRWLGQKRYNGPTGGRNRPQLPDGDVAKRPGISADGGVVTWDAYRLRISEAERLGEIHVRGARLTPARSPFGVSVGEPPGSRRPTSSYNSVLSADGAHVAYETAESTFPLAKRVGQMSVLVRDLTSGVIENVSHGKRPAGAPSRTAFNPSISADGQVVAFEATDSGTAGAPARSALLVADRRSGEERRLVEHGGVGAAFLPRLSADGSVVAYTDADPVSGRTQVYVRAAAGGEPVLVSRAAGPGGVPADADAYEPAISADGSVVAFTTRAANLGLATRASKIVVRDLRSGATEVVEGGGRGDALEPALSADGRFVAYVLRRRVARVTPRRLRSSVLLWDRRTGSRTLVSAGRRGAPADGYASEPAVSADGSRVVFTSSGGALSGAKPTGLAGVFVRDLAQGSTQLLSRHAWPARRAGRRGGARASIAAAAPHAGGPMALCALG